ncbi:phosphatidylinositol transfer protein csr1 [Coemansia erecta]|uniref:Phosphatidylinositol transfer protein csr1 n=1 Tax=Coemansia erecta TaxID=147472 RepID=A0A9W7Y0Q4_9FUNG|nr:phosphatidylinositol transfer protein csr1 [Coemansia erecta]
MTNPVIEQYTTGKPIVDGTFGHLTAEQTTQLKELWRKLFDTFSRAAADVASAPLPDAIKKAETTSGAAGGEKALHQRVLEGEQRSSSAPPGELELKKPHHHRHSRNGSGSGSDSNGGSSRSQRRAASPAPSTSSGSSGWFGWGGSKQPAEAPEYRQLVEDVADEASLAPDFEGAAAPTAQSIRAAFWTAVLCDHPDVLLLRFLRARKWHVDDALAMLLACLRWRIDEQLDRVVWEGEGPINLAVLRRGVGAVHKTDRIGQPVLHIPVRLNDPKAQPSEHMVAYTVYLMEVARVVLHPPAEKVCLLFDTTDMSLANMDWTFFRTFLHYLEHYYPECLGLVLIYNASWVFNGLWKLIRPLLDPVVAAKVHFLASRDEITAFIAPEHLPREFGGADAFTYAYPMPVPGENDAMRDAAGRQAAAARRQAACDALEAATRTWVGRTDTGDGDDAADEARRSAADELVAASRALDRFVRARTLYHRLGVIGDDLTVDWNRS